MCHNFLIKYPLLHILPYFIYYLQLPYYIHYSQNILISLKNKIKKENCTKTPYIRTWSYQKFDFVLLIKPFLFLKNIIKSLNSNATYQSFNFFFFNNFSNILFFVLSNQACFYIDSLSSFFLFFFLWYISLILTQLFLQSFIVKIIVFHCFCFTITKMVFTCFDF